MIEDEGHSFEQLVLERFGPRAPEALAVHEELIERAGIYLFDLNANNIKFGGS